MLLSLRGSPSSAPATSGTAAFDASALPSSPFERTVFESDDAFDDTDDANIFEDAVPGLEEEAGNGENDESAAEALIASQKKILKLTGSDLVKVFGDFQKETDMHAHVKKVADTYKKLKIIKTSVLGTTYEKRSIRVYTLGYGNSGRDIMIIGQEHAAEWSSSASLMYLIVRLVQLYGIHPDITEALDELHPRSARRKPRRVCILNGIEEKGCEGVAEESISFEERIPKQRVRLECGLGCIQAERNICSARLCKDARQRSRCIRQRALLLWRTHHASCGVVHVRVGVRRAAHRRPSNGYSDVGGQIFIPVCD